MSKNVFEIQLPFFAGFYESVLYNSDTLYYEVNDGDNLDYYRERFEDDTLEPDDLDIDFEAYKEDVSKAFVEAFDLCTPDFVKEIEMTELSSPRFYNYSTDKLYANVTFEDDWKAGVMSFMEKNKEALAERIKKDWTSYDGFMSFIENDYDKWVEEFQKDEPDERYIGSMLGYIIEDIIKNERPWDNDPYYVLNTSALEDVYIGNYIINTKENKGGE